jgi:hypothetical protein
MRTYNCLSERFYTPKKRVINGRYGATYKEFMRMVDGVIIRVTESFDSMDLADTILTRDAGEDGEDPVDLAERILLGDTIGAQFLALALGEE